MSLSVCSQHLALKTAACIVDVQSKYLSASGICSYLTFFFEPILFPFYGILNCITLAYLSFLVLCFYDRDIYAKTCKSLHQHRRASWKPHLPAHPLACPPAPISAEPSTIPFLERNLESQLAWMNLLWVLSSCPPTSASPRISPSLLCKIREAANPTLTSKGNLKNTWSKNC